MRHNADVKSFNRPYNQRVALMRGLVVNLVEHERIKTTLAKAKELRRLAERSVTLAKRGSLHARRTLISRLANEDTVIKLFSTLAPRFKDRNGGYTRIYKLDPRPGDNAEMALIEFLGAEIKAPGQKATEQKEAKAKKTTAKKTATGEKKAAKAKKVKKD